MKKTRGLHLTYLFGLIAIILLLGLASYLQVYKDMTPCPLCMLQRFVFIALGVMFFVGMFLHTKKLGQIIISLLSLVITVAGILLSSRQAWLQHRPPATEGECGVSLSYMLDVMPITDVLKHVWIGGAECSQQGWVLWNLSLAEWSLLGFCGFFVLVLVQLKHALEL